ILELNFCNVGASLKRIERPLVAIVMRDRSSSGRTGTTLPFARRRHNGAGLRVRGVTFRSTVVPQVIEFILQIFLEDVTMATIGAFINLPEPENDKETRLRQKILETVLIGHQLKYVYGKAEYDQYPDKANVLASTDPIPDIFLATCWPSMDAL